MTQLYVIRDEGVGAYKVGLSTDPGTRIRSLQTGNPTRLKLVAACRLPRWFHGYAPHEVEALCHEALSGFRRGGEWFHKNRILDELLCSETDGALTVTDLARWLHWHGPADKTRRMRP